MHGCRLWRAHTCGPDGCRRADDRLGIVQLIVDEIAQAQAVHQQLVAMLVALAAAVTGGVTVACSLAWPAVSDGWCRQCTTGERCEQRWARKRKGGTSMAVADSDDDACVARGGGAVTSMGSGSGSSSGPTSICQLSVAFAMFDLRSATTFLADGCERPALRKNASKRPAKKRRRQATGQKKTLTRRCHPERATRTS